MTCSQLWGTESVRCRSLDRWVHDGSPANHLPAEELFWGCRRRGNDVFATFGEVVSRLDFRFIGGGHAFLVLGVVNM